MRTLRQCLVDTDLTRLRVIARLWGLELGAARPLEAAAELSAALTDAQNVAEAWRGLPEVERAALKTLVNAGGTLPAAAFARQFGPIRPMGPGRLQREKPWQEPAGPAEGLWYRGWIYKGFQDQQTEPFEVVFVPQELLALLPFAQVHHVGQGGASRPQAPSNQGRLSELPPIGPPSHARPSGDLFLDDVCTILAFIQNEKPSPPFAGAWPQRAYLSVLNELRLKASERVALIYELVDHLGWTRVDSDSNQLKLAAEPVIKWLRASAFEQRQALVQAWQEITTWNELWRLKSVQPDETGTWRNDPTLARKALLRHLAQLETGEWYLLADFIAAIKADDPDFQRPGGVYDTWYIRDAFTGLYLMGFESWDKVEGVLLTSLLTGPACWLGLVDLGADSESSVPAAFCLTPAGKQSDPGPPPSLAAPVVAADLTISIPSPRRFERFQLARIADLVACGDDFVYRLTPNSLNRARAQGINVNKVLDFVGELAQGPVPASVRSSAVRWAKQGTEVRLEPVILLYVNSQEMLQQIVTSPQTRRYVGRVVGPTAATVPQRHWSRLVAALADMGLLADVDGLLNDEGFSC